MADECRHHKAFAELAASLKSEADQSPEGPIVPYLDLQRAEPEQVADVSRRLLQLEKEDAKELKKLQGMLRRQTAGWTAMPGRQTGGRPSPALWMIAQS